LQDWAFALNALGLDDGEDSVELADVEDEAGDGLDAAQNELNPLGSGGLEDIHQGHKPITVNELHLGHVQDHAIALRMDTTVEGIENVGLETGPALGIKARNGNPVGAGSPINHKQFL
jgi:hypothetical protein